MRHVGKEFGLGSVGEFGSLSGSCVSLDGVSQVEDHLINLALQFVHFSRCLDGDELCEVSISGGISDVSKSTDLSRQVHSHGVDI